MCYMGSSLVFVDDVIMQLFGEKKEFVFKKKYKKVELKQCCKCGNESNNTILYTEKEIICMNCYCELIAKDRRLKCEQGQ